MLALAPALLDLVLPRRCAGCGRDGELLCSACVGVRRPMVVEAGGNLPVLAAGRYEGALRAAVLAYKERGRSELARPLADLLRPATAVMPHDVVLVPVPSSRSAAAARGGNHVLRLARATVRGSGRPVVDLLRFQRAVRDSAGLSAPQRAVNLAGAMTAAREHPVASSLRVLLVDDIVTTGATITEATRALRSQGWPVIGAVVLAQTPRRDGSEPLAHPDGSV